MNGTTISKRLASTVIGGMMAAVMLCPQSWAAEEGFREVQVSPGHTVILGEGQEMKQNGAQIVMEDLSASNSKKIRQLQAEITKLREENKELKSTLKKFETQLSDRLEDVKTDLADLKAEVRSK